MNVSISFLSCPILMSLQRLLLVGVVVISLCSAASAETILFESGTLGETGIPISELTSQNVPGTNVNDATFVGVRFQLDEPVITSQIGGHFVANSGGSFFGAIVELDDENDFPVSDDFTTGDVLGSTLLNFPTPSNETWGNLQLSLDPGWYAMVFGSGVFGAQGSGVAVRNGVDIGNPPYIFKGPNFGWSNVSIAPNHRFVVTGRVVPEPSPIVTCVIGAIFLLLSKRW